MTLQPAAFPPAWCLSCRLHLPSLRLVPGLATDSPGVVHRRPHRRRCRQPSGGVLPKHTLPPSPDLGPWDELSQPDDRNFSVPLDPHDGDDEADFDDFFNSGGLYRPPRVSNPERGT